MMAVRYGQKRKPTYVTAAKIRRALAALNLPDGMTKPYRPVPQDFRERYVEMGWDGIDEHYGTNWRVIRRWIEIVGRASLIRDRADYVEEQRAARREERKRRVVGC
jgi:hypothetical protein